MKAQKSTAACCLSTTWRSLQLQQLPPCRHLLTSTPNPKHSKLEKQAIHVCYVKLEAHREEASTDVHAARMS